MLIALVLAATLQSAPELIASSPTDGAVEVSPGEQMLRFTFDQPMKRDRWSVTDGDLGAKPQFTGEPAFSADGRSFTIRMRLEPHQTYVVGVNGPRHENFQGEGGAAAKPALIRFTTAAER